MMVQKTKAQMVTECNLQYRNLIFLNTLDQSIWVVLEDVPNSTTTVAIKEAYEQYMSIAEDIYAMRLCLIRRIEATIRSAINEMCGDYHVTPPASIKFDLIAKKGINTHGVWELREGKSQ